MKKTKRRFVSRTERKGFLIANRRMADRAFRGNMPDDQLVHMARAEGLFSKNTPDENIWFSLHQLWFGLDA